MPYKIKKANKQGYYDILRADTGEKVGQSGSKMAAQRSVNARNAGEHGWKGTKKKKQG